MPAIAEADEDAELNDTGADALPQTTLAQMRAVLGRCGAGLDGLPADAAGALMERVDRPLMVAQVSKGWRAAVRGALPRAPLRYVADYAKYHASTSTDKNREMLADLALKCGQYDVVAITISNMRHRNFTDASGLAPLLPRCPNLESLDLSKNALLIDTLPGLRACMKLTMLDLSYGYSLGQAIMFAADAFPPSLRQLRLKDASLSNEVRMEQLSVALGACPGLTHLDLRNNEFGPSSWLMRMLEQLPALERLELSGTGMRQTGLRDVAESLRACTRLTYLDLSRLRCYDPRNRGADGMTAIQEHYDAGDEFMRMLPSWQALTHLDLSDMFLGADATHFAASLHALPGLTFLNVCNSDIGAQGITNIAAALSGMPKLEELNMCHCGIAEDGARALVGVLPQCGALRVLKLKNNALTSAGAQGLAAVIQQCPNLTFLDLRNTELEQATIDEIVAAWRAQHEPRGECAWKGRRWGIKCTAKHFD